MEDEIDLRQYAAVLVKRWKWIVGVTMLAALVAGVVSFTTTPTYEATALVFLLFNQTNQPGAPPKSLLSPQTQLTLLQSNDIAQRVVQTLGDKLTPAEKNALLRIDGTNTGPVRVNPDQTDKSLFRVTAQASRASTSADIANAWAAAGTDAINQAENQSLSQSIPALQRSVTSAAADLQTAEDNLKRLQTDLQIDLTTQQLARVQQIR